MRLFVAIDFPDAVKDQLAALQTAVPTARWVKRAQLHLTLRFIGDAVNPQQLPALKAALSAVKVEPFEMRLSGVGRFPPAFKKPPRVLWAGVEAPPALADLQQQVEAGIVALGFPPQDHAFSPHITLARLNAFKPLPEANAFLERHHAFVSQPVPVTAFTLYSSILAKQGPSYTRESTFPLAK